MFAIASFVTSGVLIIGLFALRHVEIGRGNRFFPRFRKTLDYLALLFVKHVFIEAPRLLVRAFKYTLLQITHFFSSMLLHVVQFIEEKLHVAVHKVRGKKNDLAKAEPASNHLTDMKNHKQAVSKTIEELGEVE